MLREKGQFQAPLFLKSHAKISLISQSILLKKKKKDTGHGVTKNLNCDNM